jgi:hypothetical protein
MVVVLNGGPSSGTCYQQGLVHHHHQLHSAARSLLSTSGLCLPFSVGGGGGGTPAFTNAPSATSTATTTLCCFQCCRPLTVHFGVGLLGCSPYRQFPHHNHPSTNASTSSSYLACVPCGRWFDSSSVSSASHQQHQHQNNWLGPPLYYWNNQLLLRCEFYLDCNIMCSLYVCGLLWSIFICTGRLRYI